MKPSALSTRAISTFSFEVGMTTLSCRAREALRMRVSMSPTGSFTGMTLGFSSSDCLAAPRLPGPSGGFAGSSLGVLPGALHQPCYLARQRAVAQADSAHLKLAQKRARPPTQRAAVVGAHLELRLALG